jgi:uncharacterized protein (TIGR02145 family)/prepilin-type N-terminal cleavage/methylation domain-containing protein
MQKLLSLSRKLRLRFAEAHQSVGEPKLKRGFTLLEILLVVGIISILAGIVIIAINPSKQLATVRNSQRKSNIKQIESAITQYYIDNSSYPSLITFTDTTICNTGASSTASAGYCTGGIDLYALVPTYLTAMPTDPQTTAGATSTGYYIKKDKNNKVTLTAVSAELGTAISIGNCPMIVDTRDNKSYKTILIGSQCWMAQNLNVGNEVAGVTTQTDNVIIEKYCYDNNENNCSTYGGLYQWDEMMGYSTNPGIQGICPTDWHIPTDTEYKTLVEGQATPGCESSTGWQCSPAGSHLSNLTLNHDNSSGFTGLLAGYRGTDGSFYGLSGRTYLWSSSESGTSAWRRDLNSGSATVYRYSDGKAYGFSVRCLKD